MQKVLEFAFFFLRVVHNRIVVNGIALLQCKVVDKILVITTYISILSFTLIT